MTTNTEREWIDADKLRAVLARLDREYFAVADSNPRPGRDEHTTGYLAGIDTAHAWLQKALEGTHNCQPPAEEDDYDVHGDVDE